MSEAPITVPTPHGDVTLPYAQAVAVGRCIEMLRFQGKDSTWHPADCGCCYVVHENVGDDDHTLIPGGFIIGQDGAYDWVDTQKTEGEEG